MQRRTSLAISFSGLVGLGFAFPGAAKGRTQYDNEFAEMYADKKAAFEAMKCGVCHGEKGPTRRSGPSMARPSTRRLAERT